VSVRVTYSLQTAASTWVSRRKSVIAGAYEFGEEKPTSASIVLS
jgi:hypothetical protein